MSEDPHKLMSVLLLTSWLLIFLNPCRSLDLQVIRSDTEIKFVSGTVAEYLPDPIFYDTVVPLMYEFGIPRHMESAVKLMWDHATVCNASDSRYDGKLCPVVHHLHKVVANLSHDMGFWKDFYPADITHLPQIEEKEKPMTNTVMCDEITQHFSNHFTSSAQMEKYIENLKGCHLGEFFHKTTFDHSWIIDKSIYYTMIERFYQEFYRSLPSTGFVDWVVTLNSYTALQGILLTNNYIESSRLKNAILSCQSGYIPESFVSKAILKRSLEELFDKISGAHYTYLFEFENDLSPYYKIPLADCTFTENYTFIVRVLVPVKVADVASKLLQLSTMPFIQNINNTVKLCTMRIPGKMKMIESNSGLLFETDCNSAELCKTSELNSFYQSEACVSAVLSNSEDQIYANCELNCFPTDIKTLPIFRKIAPDTFVAVGTSDYKIFITCNGQPYEMLKLKDLGALQIKLACNCRITYRNQIFRPLSPCGNKLSIEHVMPFNWENRRQTNTNHSLTSTTTRSAILMEREEEEIQKLFNGSAAESEKQVLKEIMKRGYSVSGGFIAQICFLWIFIAILVASNIFLLYHIYLLIKWKELQVYKDTRIVYNVPESPKISNKF